MSSPDQTFSLSAEQAEIYESTFVPALFAQWAPLLLAAAQVGPGQRVLDVACGTGVLARAAADIVGSRGTVAGVDLNDGMLTVARRLRPELDWRRSDAADLPYGDGTFDVVLCQSALMFFPDAPAALREMGRVCAPGGAVGVQVYSSIDAQPAYGPFVAAVARHAGDEAIDLLSTYWVHGDPAALRELFELAGLEVTGEHTHLGRVEWSSIAQMVDTEIDGTPLAGRIGAEVRRSIHDEVQAVLGHYETGHGAPVPIEARIVIARHG